MLRNTVCAFILGTLMAIPAASAGSYQVSCKVKAKFDGKTYDFRAQHYNSKRDADFDPTPNTVSLDVNDKTLKLKTKKKVGALRFYDFRDIQVVYAGTAKESMERWAFFYGKDGQYIARVQCK